MSYRRAEALRSAAQAHSPAAIQSNSPAAIRALLLAVWLLVASTTPATAMPSETDAPANLQKFRALTKQIMVKEIELERFNLRYWLSLNKQSRLKHWRFFAAREANDSSEMSEYITGASQRLTHKHHPDEISKGTIRRGKAAGLTGDCIGAAASTFELSANTVEYLRKRKAATGRAAAVNKIKALTQEISSMLEQRAELIRNAPKTEYSSTELEIAAAEGVVLEDVLHVLSREFIHVMANARANGADENCFYALNASTGYVGIVKGILGLKSLDRHTLAGPAQIWTVIQGGMIVITPYASNLAGKAAKHIERVRVKRAIGFKDGSDNDKLRKDMDHLEQLLSAEGLADKYKGRPIFQRLALEKEGIGKFLRGMEAEESRLRELNKVAVEKEKEATVVGGAQIAAGILGLIASYGVKHDEIRANSYEAAADITATCGYAVAVGNNFKSQIMGEIERRHLRREHKEPYQLVEERLMKLGAYQEKLEQL